MADRGANIDLIFRNGLKDFEVLPPPDVWEGIRPVAATKHRTLIFSRIAASGALIVAIGSAAWLSIAKLPELFNGPAITLNQEEMPDEARFLSQSSSPLNNTGKLVADALSEYQQDVKQAAPVYYFNYPEINLFKPIGSETITDSYNNKQTPAARERVSRASQPENFSGDRAEPKLKESTIRSPENSHWSIGAAVSPSYYSRISFGSDDAARNLVSAEKAAVSYSGGFSLAYSPGKRLSLQAGIYYSSIGQKISGISSYSGFGQYINTKSGSPFTVVTSSGTITSGNNDIFLMDNNSAARVLTVYTRDVFDPVKSDLTYINNSVYQNFNYVEIPLIVKYKIVDRSIDFNVVGGLSYNLLMANSAYATRDGEKFYIGQTEGLSPVTFSSTFGMGMEYKLSSKLSLNVEPTFRYYLTPLGGLAGSSIHPYSFGILSGVFYKF